MKNYKECHQKINPLNDNISFDEWKKIISRDLDEKHSFVFLKEDVVEAYVLCYKENDRTKIEIGYVGGKEVCQMETYLTFYETCLNELFNDFDQVFIEADDVVPYAFAVLNQFEYDDKKSFDTYLL